ncbi:AAA family ATPase [bacterium]|nr:AAA family ATPase [bacterium]
MIIAFSGKISSGKTTLSKEIASNLGIACASFGDYVRSIARERGLDEKDRRIVQNVGQSLIESGWREFCNSVLEAANWRNGDSIVVDGIRHCQAVATIKEIVKPQPFRLIYVEVDSNLRLERLGKNSTEMARMDAHSTEADVQNVLRSIADKCVDGSRDLDDLIVEISDYVGNEK